MAYVFYMDDVALPVPPSKMQTSIKNKNKTITLINDGEVNVLKAAGLTEISFTLLIPHVQFPFAYYPNGFLEASYYLDKFERLKVGKKPFMFKCSRTSPSGGLLFDTNLRVSLEDYKISEDASDPQGLTVTINLKQYKEYGTQTLNIEASATGSGYVATVEKVRETDSAPEVLSYTVKTGDTLWNIAKKNLGDGTRYEDIASLNSLSNPSLIYPGQILTLPSLAVNS